MNLEQAIQTSGFKSFAHRAEVNLLFTSYLFKANFARELKKVDCTTEQYNVLRILKGSHPRKMCVRDIAGRMIERNSNVPRIIDRLVAKNWVERAQNETDKRETVISLTDAGSTHLKRFNEILEKHSEDHKRLTEAEFKTLNALLDKWRG